MVPPGDGERGEVAGGVARGEPHRLLRVLRVPALLRRRGCHRSLSLLTLLEGSIDDEGTRLEWN